ncbi:hypothetical protein OEZ85_001672 [Tetradesmus obliquus]|uniref:SBP-type domain-containing protein n=1 Tax=Tetradesmus obliquus TaxID=3088 RepID=A0ABY8U3C6_TETOB|nr:hypothetical protein OEZ85_001672 [Tetradesmus obliquus]
MENQDASDVAPGARKQRERCCKASGCCADLRSLGNISQALGHRALKPYCLKKGLCPEHMKTDALRLKDGGDQLWRYCQQCGKLEPLSCFKHARVYRVQLQQGLQGLVALRVPVMRS